MMSMALGNEITNGSSGTGAAGSSTVDSSSASPPVEIKQAVSANPKSSAPSSPDSEQQQQLNQKSNSGAVRPPGANGPLPSPIGKSGAGNSKNTAATSPLLTLTPNSSVDGSSDWHGLSSAVPSLPFLQPEHRRGQGESSSFGSFDLANNDGLLGLEALRERAHTSPSPVQMLSSSPPIIGGPRGQGYAPGASVAAQDNGNQDRARSVPRDRPPLSQSYQEGNSAHGERNNFGFSSNRSTGSDASYDSGFGAIGRIPVGSEFRSMQSDYDMNRRRASSGEDFYSYALDPTTVSQKFGTLPTLGSHIQQHRMSGSGFGDELERPRHIRSVSQPMPVGQVPSSGAALDQRFYQQGLQQDGHSYSGGEFRPKSQHGSLSHPTFASYDGYVQQKRVSLPNLNQSHSYGQFQNVRGNSNEYSPLSHGHGSIASAEDMRGFGAPSMISPGHSPVQVYYGGGPGGELSRQSSDAGSTMLSSSPMSMGGGLPRAGANRIPRYQHVQGDEELTHPLVGEHIEVPDHDDFHGSIFGGMPRNPGHGHSLSLDHIPSYMDPGHHLPSSGAVLPLPKVVYAVKFKRTQRNFVLGPRISRDLKIGTYVKVEADRGEDLGIVVGKIAAEKYNFSGGRSSFQGPPSAGMSGGATDLKRIIRLATHDEVSLLSMKREEEDELLKICRSKVRQRGLPMHVVDAEYQFDRHKLTFFFEAEGRVDFRELVRDLFSMYKTRIWMQQIDKSTASSAQAMMNPSASAVQMDYGTPIIAPVSEFADSIVLGGFGDARSH